MKIVTEEKITMTFDDVEAGQVFLVSDAYYLKTNNIRSHALNLKDFTEYEFNLNEIVEVFPDSTLVIK